MTFSKIYYFDVYRKNKNAICTPSSIFGNFYWDTSLFLAKSFIQVNSVKFCEIRSLSVSRRRSYEARGLVTSIIALFEDIAAGQCFDWKINAKKMFWHLFVLRYRQLYFQKIVFTCNFFCDCVNCLEKMVLCEEYFDCAQPNIQTFQYWPSKQRLCLLNYDSC